MLETLDSVLPAHKPGLSRLPTECEASLRANLSLEERKTAKDSATLPEDLSWSQSTYIKWLATTSNPRDPIPPSTGPWTPTHMAFTHTPRKNNKISK